MDVKQPMSENTLSDKIGGNGASEETTKMAEAISQVKQATSSVYEAVGSLGTASAGSAKLKMEDGKARAAQYGSQAENALRERPLVAVGIAFAAGLIVSRLIKGSDQR